MIVGRRDHVDPVRASIAEVERLYAVVRHVRPALGPYDGHVDGSLLVELRAAYVAYVRVRMLDSHSPHHPSGMSLIRRMLVYVTVSILDISNGMPHFSQMKSSSWSAAIHESSCT